MKDDPVYTGSDCFETFPFPLASNYELMEMAGKNLEEYRRSLMERHKIGLTETYNRFHDRDEKSPEILRLRDLHAELDTRELESQIKDRFSSWITEVLNATTSGIITNPKKCEVVLGKNTSSGAIRTSLSMKRVNRNASGVMDLFLGAETLHYHMFQHVIVANSGEFGGSSGHAPFKDRHARTIFHTHGSEQVAISFFEIDFDLYKNGQDKLKHPPANFTGRKY